MENKWFIFLNHSSQLIKKNSLNLYMLFKNEIVYVYT